MVKHWPVRFREKKKKSFTPWPVQGPLHMVHSNHSPTTKHHMPSTQQSAHQSIKQNKYSTKKPKTSKLKERVTDREQRREREREKAYQSSSPRLFGLGPGMRRRARVQAWGVELRSNRPGMRRRAQLLRSSRAQAWGVDLGSSHKPV